MPHTHKGRHIPYPFNTNKETMQLWVLDRQVIFAMQGQPSFIDWKGKPPARCLDLGCGFGDWPVDSARLWPNSTFVGFDIADLQIDLRYVEPSIARRIKWVHGNFLEKLPFNDSEFDYVHISAIAFCVPEDKWHSVYDEICRVLKPNGYVEQGEEDPVFPVLPRWFTTPLHVGTSDEGREANERDDELPHAHKLLEKLFYAVFESRFINTTPSSMLPGYFSASFKHVISPPIVKIPMPPLAPLPPFDLENIPISAASMRSLPKLLPLGPAKSPDATDNMPEPQSTVSSNSAFSFASSYNTSLSAQSQLGEGLSDGRSRNASVSTTNTSVRSTGRKSTGSGSTGSGSQTAGPAYAGHNESTHVGAHEEVYSLWNLEGMAEMDEHSLYVHLTHAAGLVNGVKEAMWEELKKMVSRRDKTLKQHGWSQLDYTDETSRRLFEDLWNRYQRDLRDRIAMWHPMVHYGWEYPRHNVMTEMEIAEQERLRARILEARELAKDEEIQHPIRITRLLVGMNGKGK